MRIVMPPRLQTIHNKSESHGIDQKKISRRSLTHRGYQKGTHNCLISVSWSFRFSDSLVRSFPASREIPNFDLRLLSIERTQRFLVLIGSLIGMMHMVKIRIRFWNFLQRLYFLCFLSDTLKRFKILLSFGDWGARDHDTLFPVGELSGQHVH